MINRNMLAIYCAGQGIEIGAYHFPFPICKPIAQVTYVDKWPTEKMNQMRDNDPNLRGKEIVNVDIVDDGEWLRKIPDNSQSFVISSHQLEHCISPLTAIKNHMRVLKPKGVIVYAIPDKRFTFDKDRQLTSYVLLKELYYDLQAGVSIKRQDLEFMYDDYYEHVDKINDVFERKKRIEQAIADNADVHFHVWNADTLLDMLLCFKKEVPYEIELFSRAGHENFVVLRKN